MIQANLPRLRDSTIQSQVAVYETYVVAALPMYNQVGSIKYFFLPIHIYIHSEKEEQIPHTYIWLHP